MVSTLHTRRVAIVLLPQPHPFGMQLINQCFLCGFVPWCSGFPALGQKTRATQEEGLGTRAGDNGWGQGLGTRAVLQALASPTCLAALALQGRGTGAWRWAQPLQRGAEQLLLFHGHSQAAATERHHRACPRSPGEPEQGPAQCPHTTVTGFCCLPHEPPSGLQQPWVGRWGRELGIVAVPQEGL